jgi:integrase/recombinase XerC
MPVGAVDVTALAVDRAALTTLAAALDDARERGDERPALVVVAATLGALGVALPSVERGAAVELVAERRSEWLRRLQSGRRADTTLTAYRVAIDDLAAWAEREQRADLDEQAVVDYFHEYRERCRPAPATYHRRFVLLRRYVRWLVQRDRIADPFVGLEAPPKPSQQNDWLTPAEFERLMWGATNPVRHHPGLAERDRLVLLTLVTTGLRRAELIALDWRDLDLDSEHPSLLVRHGKGDRSRRQPLARQLAEELRRERAQRDPAPADPVFCGLAGGRLRVKVLAAIIGRAVKRARLTKHVTVHTLRHTAATWLRQSRADTRLVAEYLGHADMSTVARYAHVADEELHDAAEGLARRAGYAATD